MYDLAYGKYVESLKIETESRMVLPGAWETGEWRGEES